MIVTPQPAPLFLPPSKTPRTKGVHVSGLIRCIATESGILKPEWAEELSLVDARKITDPQAVLRMCIGLAWEEWYINNILSEYGVLDHPGEMSVDGIYMSPDGQSLDTVLSNHYSVIHEVKATYKSTNTVGDLRKEWMWLTQMKAYCLAEQTTVARMHTLFLCGDYSFPIRPALRCWTVEFTEKELEENWKLLKDYRDKRSRE